MSSKQYHFWVVSRDPTTNRPYLIYGGRTEDEARTRGLELLGGLDFVLKRFPTSNLALASSYLRGKRLEKGLGLHNASRRQGHDKTLRRLHRRG